MSEQKTRFWKNPYEAIVCLALLLLAIGCINVFSASQVAAEDMFSNSRHYLYRYAGFSLAGLVAMFFLSRIDYSFLLKKTDFLVLLVVILLLYVF